MTWEAIEKQWFLYKEMVKANWPKLTDQDVTFIAGNQDRLRKKIQQKYLLTEGEANAEIAYFVGEQEVAHSRANDPLRAAEQPLKGAPRYR
jgi:hypothetical protein